MRGGLRKPFAIVVVGAVLAGSGVYGYGRTTGGGGGGGGSYTPWTSAVLVSYTCAQTKYAAASSSGANDGTSWANAWALSGINWTTVGNGTSAGNSCLYIDGGASSVTYGSSLNITAAGTNDTHRVVVLSGTDAGHNGVASFTGGTINFDNMDYVTVDGQGSDASTQHFRITGATLTAGYNVSPVIRYVEINGATGIGISSTGYVGSPGTGFHGLFDHVYVHNVSANDGGSSGIKLVGRNDFGGPNEVDAYDDVIIQYSHIAVNSNTGEDGTGADGIEGCPGCTVRYSLIEGLPNGGQGSLGHMDLFQTQAPWISVYGNVIKDGADSSIDYDCYNGGAPNHFRIFNNAFISARGGNTIRFYESGGNTCTSFSNIHIDNNTFVDKTCCAAGSGSVAFYTFNAQPTVSSSEIQNNVFYHDTQVAAVYIESSSGFTAANWNIDYNNISDGTAAMDVDGGTYTQTHPSTCTPSFVDYAADSSPYSSTYATLTAGGYDLSPAPGDTCMANTGTSLASQFTSDFIGTSRPQGSAWDLGLFERVGG